MRVHGLDARQGETAFAFMVLRLTTPANRERLIQVIRHVASIVPDAEAFIEELPDEELTEPFRIVGMPWLPPEAGHAVDAQRRLIDSATAQIEEAWFFQTGTSLPDIGGDDDDDDFDEYDDEDDDDEVDDEVDDELARPGDDVVRRRAGTRVDPGRAGTRDDSLVRDTGWTSGEVTGTQRVAIERGTDADDDDDDAGDDGDDGDRHDDDDQDDDPAAVSTAATDDDDTAAVTTAAADDDVDEDIDDDADEDIDDDDEDDNDVEDVEDDDGIPAAMPRRAGLGSIGVRVRSAGQGGDGSGDGSDGGGDSDGDGDDSDDDGGDDGGDDSDGDDNDEDAAWSHGPPPQALRVRFPVDGYPAILDQLDWEDFGIAFKLAGRARAGESTVLLGFHALWLAPYGGRYRNAAVTFDERHHSAHLWVDRFAVPVSPADQVHHLLWILSKLDEVVPILHARFGGASMVQKYGGLTGDDSEAFVLGGNPLIAVHAEGGDIGVDVWIAEQKDWSDEELAQMLRELAIEIVTSGDRAQDEDDDDGDHDEDGGVIVDGVFSIGAPGDDDDDDGDGPDDDDDDNDEDDAALDDHRAAATDDGDDLDHAALGDDSDDDDDDAADADDDDAAAADNDDDDEDDDDDDADAAVDDDADHDEDRGRYVASYAGPLLAARAAAGRLDPRAAATLRPLLAMSERYENRRTTVAQIAGALRDRASAPALTQIIDEVQIKSSLDSIGKEELLVEVASALGKIADPVAIPALTKLITAAGAHNDEPRPVAAEALASCLEAVPEPRELDGSVLPALIATLGRINDDEATAELHFAYGRLARTLSASARASAREQLESAAFDDGSHTVALARQVALVLSGGGTPDATTSAALRPLVHDALTKLEYDHSYTVRTIRVAVRVAEALPQLVDPDDLVWLTRFAEPDLRTKAHALLAQLGRPLEPAPVFDPQSARALTNAELARMIGEAHVVNRATLIREAGRRTLTDARRQIIKAAHDVIGNARQGTANLLDPETAVLEAAVAVLHEGPLDADTIALFDRMLRHSNVQVKWELMHNAPPDERLIGGMFHVLGQRWGWQEGAAKQWLAKFQGAPAYEAERKRAGSPQLLENDEITALNDDMPDDQEMN